jgi:hypothetical protein
VKRLSGILALVVLATACGNPHLTNPNIEGRTLPGVVADPLREIVVTNPDGGEELRVTTSNPTINGILGARNPNNEEIVVSYAFESGSHFRWNGGSFPGTNGSCAADQLPTSDCNLDIEFHADAPGVYLDNLIATYALKSDPSKTKTKKIPLRGERLADNLNPIILTPVSGGTQMNFQTDDAPVSAQLNQLNPNTEDVIVTYRFAKGDNFRFRGGSFPGTGGTCASEQLPNNSCALDIEFHASAVGRYTDELIATYALKSNPTVTKVVRMPLVGEKTAPTSSSLSVRPIGGGTSVNFGSAPVNSPVRSDRIVVENTGLTDQELTIALLGGAPFSMNHNCPATLPPATACSINVDYASTQVGTHNDIVRVTHKRPTSSTASVINVPVTGTTTAAPMRPGQLVIDGASTGNIDFGTVDSGSVNSRLVEVRNIGEMPVNLSSYNINGEAFSFNGGTYPGSRGTCGQIILPGSCTIDFSFRPVAEGTYAGSSALVPNSGSTLNINLRGKARRAGQECFETEERRVLARASANPTGVSFPYLNSASGTTMRLSTIYGTSTNSNVASLNRRTVKDAMVYVTFDMPIISDQIVDVSFNLDITKVIQDGHADTESLCISADGLRKCSGREFTLASWQKLKNPAFWSTHAAPMSTLYEDEFARGTSRCGNYTCYTMVKSLSAKDMFLLTRPELQGVSGKALNMVFSDDTRLRTMPSLTIKTKKPVACQ